ncbi:clathrin heavy chain linker domain-containing protein 1 [Ambystoma mexicanum]|uniref:clathrin heavy chain linker domain-containing protein 1 n=1 Tax=Ambystoma mexicanum TaxID=8296 RepID=UPI0037E80E8C
MSALDVSLNKSPALPPITSQCDRAFLKSIDKYIAEELRQLGCDGERNIENIYLIYRAVFDKVIEYLTSYKNILSAVKQEYDTLIDSITLGQKDAFYLNEKLKSVTIDSNRLIYYKRRATQLQDKIEIIEADSAKYFNLIEDKKAAKKCTTTCSTEPESNISSVQINPTIRMPGMTINESLDIDALAKYHFQLEKKMLCLKTEMKTKYISAKMKAELDQSLELALLARDEAESINTSLKLSCKKRKLIVSAIRTWATSDKRKTLSEFLYEEIKTEDSSEDEQVAENVFGDEDPSNIKEGDDLLEYIERFNELFEAGQYESASVHAANCPREILRNMHTMERFKAAPFVEGKVPPLMFFFEALITSSSTTKHPVSACMTLEAIKCALMQKRLDLVTHWITQQRLTFSEALGDAIFEYFQTEHHKRAECLALALAQIIYRQCGVHRKTALCMCLESQICGAVEFIHQCKKFSLDDLLFLLKKCPTNELIENLTREWNGKKAIVSTGQAVLLLIDADHKEIGFQMLEHFDTHGTCTLEDVILSDEVCTIEGWTEIADQCSRNDYIPLSQKIKSVLTSQDGIVEMSPDDYDALLMEHVFL